jgi:hypothetical protein
VLVFSARVQLVAERISLIDVYSLHLNTKMSMNNAPSFLKHSAFLSFDCACTLYLGTTGS